MFPTKATPAGWPRISSALFYDDAGAAIDWLCKAFGFEVRLRVEGKGGNIDHSELVYGDGLIMVGSTAGKSERPSTHRRSPASISGVVTQALCVFVDDVDAHCAHARTAGALILSEPATQDHGAEYWSDRSYEAQDIEGHRWWFMQRVRDAAPG